MKRNTITEGQITELMHAIPRAEEVDRLRAEIEKLREALEPFRCYCDAGHCAEYGERHASICEKGAARNVLEGKS